MKLLITGADGYIGNHLIHRLLNSNFTLLLIGQNVVELKEKYSEILSFSYVGMSQFDFIDIINSFKPKGVIHLAGYSSSEDSYEEQIKLFDANIIFLGRVLDAIKDVNLKFFVYTGSSTEFLNLANEIDPAYLYSATKSAGREVLKYYSRAYGFKMISVLPYNVYGGINSKKKIFDLLFESLYLNTKISVTEGFQQIDFIHIEDLVDLYIAIIEKVNYIPNEKMIFAGTGKGYTLRYICSLLEEESGREAMVEWGAIPYRKRDTMKSIANISFQTSVLGWNTKIELEEGIRQLLFRKLEKKKNG